MKHITCDHCGQVIEPSYDSEYKVKLSVLAQDGTADENGSYPVTLKRKWDLCRKCRQDILDLITKGTT